MGEAPGGAAHGGEARQVARELAKELAAEGANIMLNASFPAGTKIRLQSAPVRRTASATVLKIGIPSRKIPFWSGRPPRT